MSLLVVYGDSTEVGSFEHIPDSTLGGAKRTVYHAIDDVASQPEYLALIEFPTRTPAGPADAVLSALYTPISLRIAPLIVEDELPAKFAYLASVDVVPTAEEAFNTWYDSEHTELLARVPGWMRVRRYCLQVASTSPTLLPGPSNEDAGDVPGAGNDENGCEEREGVRWRKYLTIQEWSNAGFGDTPEYAALIGAERAQEMKKALLGIEIRVFELCDAIEEGRMDLTEK